MNPIEAFQFIADPEKTGQLVSLFIGVGTLSLTSWLGYLATRRIVLRMILKIVKRTRATWDDQLIESKMLDKLSYITPAWIVLSGVGFVPGLPQLVIQVVEQVALACMALSVGLAVSALLTAANAIYEQDYPQAKARPIKGYVQILQIAVFAILAIVVTAILLDQDFTVFLGGVGAMSAVLLLVFRDTILSLVASLQITSNDMIRVGDWVEMPQFNADGDVIDVALHTVKIQNWDKTITTIPTHKFIEGSFRNWRGMQNSGGRRIKRAIFIDLNSVKFLTDKEIAHLSKYEFLQDYMAGKNEELATQGDRQLGGASVIPNLRKLTNVGTFRAYVLHYLRKNSRIHQDMTLLVRQLASGSQGLPLEIYCFASDTRWAVYEDIQSDIFDHLIAILPEFALRVFQEPSGNDVQDLLRSHGDSSDGVSES
ncbi:MAG TPA: mechanosensitive ion channel [Gemmatimonadetes bacterium]|nr:mechanosensitive ion channel [Gemmatimonadota bacterium]